jgi:hypothetical protein
MLATVAAGGDRHDLHRHAELSGAQTGGDQIGLPAGKDAASSANAD